MTKDRWEDRWENTVWDTDIYLDDIDGKEPMTNEEYIKSLDTKQLAKFLADKFNEVVIAEWLKEKHK